MNTSSRSQALDILRGLSIAGMILVNNPGTWNVAFPALRHEPWVGCTAADLVFPFFVFIVGAAMSFSLAKVQSRWSGALWGKILLRTLLLFLVGVLLNAFPFYPFPAKPDLSFWENVTRHYEQLRLFGVFQRIALCYLLGAILILLLRQSKLILLALIALIATHWYLLVQLGDPHALPYHGAEGVFSLAGQGAGALDEWLVGGSHVYRGYGVPFDPEGLLGCLTGAATVLLGYLAGGILRQSSSHAHSAARLYSMGLLCLLAAYLLSSELPVIKALWTGSYVLQAGGWSMIVLALLIYLADIAGKAWCFAPLKVMGYNPLVAYILAHLLAVSADRLITWTSAGKEWSLHQWYYQEICVATVGASDAYSSLLYAGGFLLVVFVPCLILYKRGIVIKL